MKVRLSRDVVGDVLAFAGGALLVTAGWLFFGLAGAVAVAGGGLLTLGLLLALQRGA